jgi:CHAD domain-containing protein
VSGQLSDGDTAVITGRADEPSRPAGYRSKPEPADDRDAPADLAYGELLGRLLDIMRSNVDGTLNQVDIEYLHDLRVSVRRARSLVRVGEGVLPDRLRNRLRTELKWLGDATSLSRDLDVYLLGFDDLAASVPEPQTLEPYRDLLVRQHRLAHIRLNRALRAARFQRLTESWESARRPGQPHGEPIGPLADRLLRRAWRRVEKRGNAITVDSPAEAVHDLRKRCKELRYLLEFFAGLYDAGEHAETVSELKKLQTNLGAFQDAESQRVMVLRHAELLGERGVPAETLESMRLLDQHLAQQQATAHEEFGDRWARFDRPHNWRLFRRLVQPDE